MNTLPEFTRDECALCLEAGFTPSTVRLFLDTGFDKWGILSAARDRVQKNAETDKTAALPD